MRVFLIAEKTGYSEALVALPGVVLDGMVHVVGKSDV